MQRTATASQEYPFFLRAVFSFTLCTRQWSRFSTLRNGHIEPFGSLSRLKQNVNKDTRPDHRALMDGMIKLYSAYKDSMEKRSMGFMMSDWDEKLLKYGAMFEEKLMDLSVNIPLEDALDLGWKILAECFEPNETGLRSDLISEYWPK